MHVHVSHTPASATLNLRTALLSPPKYERLDTIRRQRRRARTGTRVGVRTVGGGGTEYEHARRSLSAHSLDRVSLLSPRRTYATHAPTTTRPNTLQRCIARLPLATRACHPRSVVRPTVRVNVRCFGVRVRSLITRRPVYDNLPFFLRSFQIFFF